MEVPEIDANILPHTTPGPLGGEDAPIDSSLPEAVRLCNLHHLSKVSVALNQAYIWTSWAPVTNRNTHRVDQEVAEMTSSMLPQCRHKHPQKPGGIRCLLRHGVQLPRALQMQVLAAASQILQ